MPKPDSLRTIIAGCRDLDDMNVLHDAVRRKDWHICTVLSGGATGADALGERWARHYHVPVERYPADWETHGRAAGPIRNREMASKAEALIALWDGKSRGTENMIEEAKKAGLRVLVHRFDLRGHAKPVAAWTTQHHA